MGDAGSPEAGAATTPTAAAGSPTAARHKQIATDSKVVNFVRSVRGLNAFSGLDLDELLWDWRFELLPPLNPGEEGSAGVFLPQFQDIPSREEMHDLLVGRKIPGLHQMIAHILYPDSVCWPESGKERGKEAEEEPAAPADQERLPDSVAQVPESPAASAPASPASVRRKDGRKAAQGQRSGRHASTELDGSPAEALCAAAKVGSLRDAPRHGRSHPEMRPSAMEVRSPKAAPKGPEVYVKGQLVTSSVLQASRGSQREPKEDSFGGYVEGQQDDRRLKAARERRKKTEKALKLEQYQEKRLAEQIKDLEQLCELELEHQADLQRREERREAHNRELKKRLDEGFSRKMEEEKQAEQAKEEEREKESKREQRRQAYHARQKEALEKWQTSRSESPGRDRREKAATAARDARPLTERRKTQRELEAEMWQHLSWLASEQRPPLPPPAPKRHDLPSPRAGFEAAEVQPASWRSQAKVVSNLFGLSEKEQSTVVRQFKPVPPGAGRLGRCMMPTDRPALPSPLPSPGRSPRHKSQSPS